MLTTTLPSRTITSLPVSQICYYTIRCVCQFPIRFLSPLIYWASKLLYTLRQGGTLERVMRRGSELATALTGKLRHPLFCTPIVDAGLFSAHTSQLFFFQFNKSAQGIVHTFYLRTKATVRRMHVSFVMICKCGIYIYAGFPCMFLQNKPIDGQKAKVSRVVQDANFPLCNTYLTHTDMV